ncbi:phospholipid carrier-dependent glycosyltransferase [Crocosphaera subtropica]
MFRFFLIISTFFFVSLALRFWNLGQFNTLVFDEVYYAKFANNYLTQTPFFNSHPPLTEYLIAIGIWMGSWFPASPDITNNLTGSWHSTVSYRWLNALTGSFFPIILGAIAYQLTHRYSYTIIVTFLATLEGLFLVESRYALNNIYLVNFGLLSHLLFLLFINQKKYLCLTLSGIFLGAASAIKWNGLGFLLGIYLIIFIVYLSQKLKHLFDSRNLGIVENINCLKPSLLLFNLLVIPMFTYSILWLPYLLLNPEYSWWEIHQKIWSFHQSIGDSSDVHPYCSKWYSWLIMARPIAYFYEKINTPSGTIIYDVHAMGNPILWWLATGSILIFSIFMIVTLFKQKYNPYLSVILFIIINYFANLLPWTLVSRCTFLYHYMPSYSFSLLGIGLIIEQCLISGLIINRRLGIILLLLISFAFIYWLPIYLGLPLSLRGFDLRMLPNWI